MMKKKGWRRVKLSLEPIAKIPRWALGSKYTHRPCDKCTGWFRLSRCAILIFCKDDMHMPRERVSRGMSAAFILKRFPNRRLVRYNMRFKRALQGRKPRPHIDDKSMVDVRWGTWGYIDVRESDKSFYERNPLTDAEWMYATALMYFLGRN